MIDELEFFEVGVHKLVLIEVTRLVAASHLYNFSQRGFFQFDIGFLKFSEKR